MKARWHNTTLADSEEWIELEGNVYFPPDRVRREFLRPSDTTTVCPWKGIARYFDVVVDGEVNPDAAWTYPEPKPDAREIRNYIAFWEGVEISE